MKIAADRLRLQAQINFSRLGDAEGLYRSYSIRDD